MRFVLSILCSQWRGNLQGAFSDLSQIFYVSTEGAISHFG